jgi:glucokinase
MAGPVNDNIVSVTVNIQHWGPSDGNKIAQEHKFDSFTFLNDFTAAGYGISVLTPSDYVVLGDSAKAPLIEGPKSVKIVVGPGTGLG